MYHSLLQFIYVSFYHEIIGFTFQHLTSRVLASHGLTRLACRYGPGLERGTGWDWAKH